MTTIKPDHALSVRKAFTPQRICWRCSKHVRYIVYVFPLCRKHALEEFIQNLKGFIEGEMA